MSNNLIRVPIVGRVQCPLPCECEAKGSGSAKQEHKVILFYISERLSYIAL